MRSLKKRGPHVLNDLNDLLFSLQCCVVLKYSEDDDVIMEEKNEPEMKIVAAGMRSGSVCESVCVLNCG